MIKMFLSIVLLAGMIFGLAPFTLAGEGREDHVTAWRLETQGWSLEDHMAAAKEQEQALQSLEMRVLDVEKRIANLEKKPYFDTKGFKRTALQHVAENLKGKVNTLNERVAWHYRQADQAKLTE